MGTERAPNHFYDDKDYDDHHPYFYDDADSTEDEMFDKSRFEFSPHNAELINSIIDNDKLISLLYKDKSAIKADLKILLDHPKRVSYRNQSIIYDDFNAVIVTSKSRKFQFKIYYNDNNPSAVLEITGDNRYLLNITIESFELFHKLWEADQDNLDRDRF